ncbi:Sphingomyelinase family protein [Phaffia rhodozyma]|uniref:Sphingomyelinase family protein n=1 Tax=Phaffia rhodozyma TaxID=264483 RepID=A0A0F7SJH0_PHARH|nr:Sphingomyelinase family protein [Phaffia rhodozyma]
MLEILTLNCWGLRPISKYRIERVNAIAIELLASRQYDLICLQEVWVREDFLRIYTRIKQNYPHSKFFITGALGSGLCIFSKHPILSTKTIPYHLSGRPLGFSDFFVNKAAGSVVIEHPELGQVEVFTTHMHAGGPEGYHIGNSYRSLQAWQLSNEIRRASSQGRYVIACGDFNFQSNELPYAVLRDHGLVKDAWICSRARNNRDVETADRVDRPCSSAMEALSEAGITVDSPLNSWTLTKNIPIEVQRTFGKRLDYIFFRDPSPPPRWPLTDRINPSLQCTSSEVVVTSHVPGKDYSYSDHFAVRASFSLSSSMPATSATTTELTNNNRYNGEISSPTLSDRSTSSNTPLSMFSGEKKRQMLNELRRVVEHHREVHVPHGRHLLIGVPVALVLLVAFTISTAFLPNHSYYSPIFAFFAGIAGFGGCVALVTGFVWARWEDGALRRSLEELAEETDHL